MTRGELRHPRETAINGQADALVTLNARDFRPAIDRFTLSLWSPGDLLRRTTA